MKKLLLCILLLCSACTYRQLQEPTNEQLHNYNDIISQFNNIKTESKTPFDYELLYIKEEDSYTYNLIIKNTTVNMYDIKALSYSEYAIYSHPSIGIFEDEIYHLCKDKVDKKNHYYKGFVLSGDVSQPGDLKLYMTYYTDINKKNLVKKVYHIKNEN